MNSGTNNPEFPGGNNHVNSPFNQNNEPLWAYNDDGILIRTIGISKIDLQNGKDFIEDTTELPTSTTSNKVNDWGKKHRYITVQSSKQGNRYNYKIIRVEQGTKQNIYKGKILAEEALEIPNNSLVVVDTTKQLVHILNKTKVIIRIMVEQYQINQIMMMMSILFYGGL